MHLCACVRAYSSTWGHTLVFARLEFKYRSLFSYLRPRDHAKRITNAAVSFPHFLVPPATAHLLHGQERFIFEAREKAFGAGSDVDGLWIEVHSLALLAAQADETFPSVSGSPAHTFLPAG